MLAAHREKLPDTSLTGSRRMEDGGGKKKEGIRQDRLVFMLLFDISALLDRPIQMLKCFQ